MARAQLTKDEIVASLKRTNVPTILVEGKDDIHVYRNLINAIDEPLLSIIACGDRDVLFKVFREIKELNLSEKKIVFIADKDNYLYMGVPDEYEDIIFTNGYCMENDLYDRSDIKEKLMSEGEVDEYRHLIDLISIWYSFEIEQLKKGLEAKTGTHINNVVPINTTSLCADFLSSINYSPADPDLVEEIKNEYSKKLRGKQIFQCLARVLTKPGRFAKYNENILIDLALNFGNENLESLKNQISQKIV
ncbi:hypothetical protein BBL88_17925 [Vibrio parahaemolyticus]|uniref:DUF4435 domain-containing protein n=1 Tax=Vibrio parahaemolyticus TaxID=670 RepID=UPI00084AF1BB|nr:DUF4435 domain-containing protein [Vibrio parahaemolyticus]ODW50024.1 hypothetical protein BBL88_17925 [Vibrio parahaemolyticus]